MLRIVGLALGTILASATAFAAVTITNFDGVGTTPNDQISHHANSGNAIQLNGGSSIQVGSSWYFYGEDYSCGSLIGTNSPWCGVHVYKSDDLIPEHYQDLGLLFNPNAGTLQTQCAAVVGGSADSGCFTPAMIFDSVNNRYVLWIYQQTPTLANAELVFFCTTPGGEGDGGTCAQQSNVTGLPSGVEGAQFFKDGSSAYVVYRDLGATPFGEQFIKALNSTYTGATGSATDLNNAGGGVVFKEGSTYYYVYGSDPFCAYCGSDPVKYQTASSALGTYSGATQINATGCGGSFNNVLVVNPGGSAVYLGYVSLNAVKSGTANPGLANQGLGTIYFQPLTVGGGAISSFSCNTTVSVSGVTAGSFQYPRGIVPDQSSMGGATFRDFCDIGPNGSNTQRFQTFIPALADVGIGLPLLQNNLTCLVGDAGCTGPDGSVTVAFKAVDGSHKPTGASLGSTAIAAASIPWAAKMFTFPLPSGLVIGTEYAVVISGSQTTACYGTSFSFTATSPYLPGVNGYSLDGGATWNITPDRAIMFFTWANQAAVGPGRMWLR